MGIILSRLVAAVVLALTLGMSAARGNEAPPVFDVWPGAVPGESRHIGPEKMDKTAIERISNVSKPTLTLFRAPKDKDTGASVVICPGGGYSILAWDLEGTEVAQWLNSAGVSAIVLKYRVPAVRHAEVKGFQPLMDVQRAISLVRSKSAEWGVDPKRIGVLGFSAGGHLSALACTNFDKRSYDAVDAIDQVSCRPDFGVLIYPAYLLVDKGDELSLQIPVTSRTPPIFFAHAGDDGISSAGSAILYLHLKRARVPSELHVYASGGHGFGLRPTTRPCSTWPARCEEWMRSQGLLTPGPAK